VYTQFIIIICLSCVIKTISICNIITLSQALHTREFKNLVYFIRSIVVQLMYFRKFLRNSAVITFMVELLDVVFTAPRVCIARTMPWRDICLSVRPSVCLSHAGIESKRLYISSTFFQYRVAPLF